MAKILIPLLGDDIAPRFDLAQEVLIIVTTTEGEIIEERPIVLSTASAEGLCNLILIEKVDTVVCCGIEQEYYEYLTWKKVKVIDSVIGPCERIVFEAARDNLQSEDVLLERG